MDLGLTGRVALVTASSGGIGMNVARTLAREGAALVLFARSADKLEALSAAITGEHKVDVLPVAGSMGEATDVERLFGEIRDRFGRLDVTVLNTGRPPSPMLAATEETEKARWDQSYDTLLTGVVEVAKRAVPMMAAGGWGRVIAITSASAHLPMPHHALSTVFRAGVEAYVKHLASEAGPSGITANCVAPALIDASHRASTVAYSPDQIAKRRELSALKRLGTHEELCGVVAFLASVQAGFVTGESIRVDGGMVTAALHR